MMVWLQWRLGVSVLVIALLLGGVGQAVLALRGAGAQAIQPTAVLGIVDVVLKE